MTQQKVRHHLVIDKNGLQKLLLRVNGSVNGIDCIFWIACANLE